MRAVATRKPRLIGRHDPAVAERFEAVEPGIVRIA
jgi:hypothetical protein